MKKFAAIAGVVLLLLCLIWIVSSNQGLKALSEDSPSANSPGATSTADQSGQAETELNAEKPNNDDLVDLTVLSSTMVYGQVFDMMEAPEAYMGKTIKMSGSYYASYSEETKHTYHYVVVQDATACCQQGLEFIWNGEHQYPDDYPADGTEIEVIGVFESYEELGQTYYYIATDKISIVD